MKKFLYLNFSVLFLLAALVIFPKSLIQGIGISILFTPLLLVYILLLGAALVFVFKARNPLSKMVSKILLGGNLLFIALFALDAINLSAYPRYLPFFLISKPFFVAYLFLISVLSFVALFKLQFSSRAKLVVIVAASLILVYSIVLFRAHINLMQ